MFHSKMPIELPAKGSPVVQLSALSSRFVDDADTRRQADARYIKTLNDARFRENNPIVTVEGSGFITNWMNGLTRGPFQGEADLRTIGYWVGQVNMDMWKTQSQESLMTNLLNTCSCKTVKSAIQEMQADESMEWAADYRHTITEYLQDTLKFRPKSHLHTLLSKITTPIGPIDVSIEIDEIEDAVAELERVFNMTFRPSVLVRSLLPNMFVAQDWFDECWIDTVEPVNLHSLGSLFTAIAKTTFAWTRDPDDCYTDTDELFPELIEILED